MPQFTRKPTPVEARQFDGSAEQARELARWCNGREIALPEHGSTVRGVSIWTPLCTRVAFSSDWIVREAPDRYVVVAAAEFAATYQPVEAAPELLAALLALRNALIDCPAALHQLRHWPDLMNASGSAIYKAMGSPSAATIPPVED